MEEDEQDRRDGTMGGFGHRLNRCFSADAALPPEMFDLLAKIDRHQPNGDSEQVQPR